MKIEQVPVAQLKPYPRNARTHPERQIAALVAAITEYGFNTPVLIDADDVLIAGHGRIEAAKRIGMADVPAVRKSDLSPEQVRALRLADNRIAAEAGWDEELLAEELAELRDLQVDFGSIGFDNEELARLLDPPTDAGGAPAPAPASNPGGPLIDSYLDLPLSVLHVDAGRWQERKRAWIASMPVDYADVGRKDSLVYTSNSRRDPGFYKKKNAVAAALGQPDLTTAEYLEKYYRPPDKRSSNGTSMFDPVLAELATIWYSPPGGLIYDPFAGDVERGLVAASKGRRYVGIDVRPEQCDANRKAAAAMGGARGGWEHTPEWRHGDSGRDIPRIWGDEQADMIFTCPPYWCLERYSQDPADLSNMSLADFGRAHSAIIEASLDRLKPDRFAVWVIGDARDKRSRAWARLQDITIDAFERAGATLENEAILVTPMAARPIFARRLFKQSRSLICRHEYILVFVKGSSANAAAALGPVEIGTLPGEEAT